MFHGLFVGRRCDLPHRAPTRGRAPAIAAARHLHGTHALVVEVAFDREDALLEPAALRAVGAFESFLAARPGVGGVLGAHSHVATIHDLFWSNQPDAYRIPDTPREVARVLFQFDRVRGEQRRREVIHDDRRRTLVTVYLKRANYRDTGALLDAIRGYARDELAPLGAGVAFAGDVAVSQAMIPAIVQTQLRSIALAFAGALLVVAAIERSLRGALLTLAPTALAATWLFGLMGWLGVPIGVATSTFCAITFGIGVDYAIHFRERVRRAAGSAHERALTGVREAGPPILADALAVALGFGVLGFSQVPANARLGLLVAGSLVAAAALTLVGLGSVLASPPRGRHTTA